MTRRGLFATLAAVPVAAIAAPAVPAPPLVRKTDLIIWLDVYAPDGFTVRSNGKVQATFHPAPIRQNYCVFVDADDMRDGMTFTVESPGTFCFFGEQVHPMPVEVADYLTDADAWSLFPWMSRAA